VGVGEMAEQPGAVDPNCPSEIESGAPDNAAGDSARMLAIDPLNPAILYATGMNGAVGVVWSRGR
jgi:hypothetical protein